MGTASDLFYGLATALGYGTGDFLARQASHRVGHVAVLFYMSLVSLAVLAPLAWFVEGPSWHFSALWVWAVAFGLLNTFASLHLYRAFEYGFLSVVSPLVSGYPAVTVTLAIVFLHETPGYVAAGGIVLALVGAILLSRTPPHPKTPRARDARKGLTSALLAFGGYGVFFFVLKYVVVGVGPAATAMLARIVTVALLAPAGALGVVSLSRPPREAAPLLFAVGFLDVGSFLAYNLGIATGSVAVVGTLSGLFSAVTVALAAVLLRERLTRPQILGVFAILLGVVLLAVG